MSGVDTCAIQRGIGRGNESSPIRKSHIIVATTMQGRGEGVLCLCPGAKIDNGKNWVCVFGGGSPELLRIWIVAQLLTSSEGSQE
jgi:hypothetical protein